MPYKANIEQYADTGERILVLPENLCEDLNLKEDDEVVIWEEDGCVKIKKKETQLYRVVLESKFKLHILVEASSAAEAAEIAKDSDDYHQVHEGFKLHLAEEITREHAKHLVAGSQNRHMAEEPYFDRLIGRKQ